MTATARVHRQTRQLPLVACSLIGVVCAVVGLLPWVVTGMRQPHIHNPWVIGPIPEQMPIVLLPFNPPALAVMAALLIVGGAVAGVVTRALHARLPRHGLTAIMLGAVLVQLIAVVQTAAALGLDFRDLYRLTHYLTLSVLMILIGVLALTLISRAPKAGALIGLGIGALLAGEWATASVVRVAMSGGDAGLAVLEAMHWLPPVLIGVAIAWAGVNTGGRVVAAITTVLGLWVVPALLTATSTAGSRPFHGTPWEMLEWAMLHLEVFAEPSNLVPLIVVATAVAVVGLLIRAVAPPRFRAHVTEVSSD